MKSELKFQCVVRIGVRHGLRPGRRLVDLHKLIAGAGVKVKLVAFKSAGCLAYIKRLLLLLVLNAEYTAVLSLYALYTNISVKSLCFLFYRHISAKLPRCAVEAVLSLGRYLFKFALVGELVHDHLLLLRLKLCSVGSFGDYNVAFLIIALCTSGTQY